MLARWILAEKQAHATSDDEEDNDVERGREPEPEPEPLGSGELTSNPKLPVVSGSILTEWLWFQGAGF